MNIGFIPLILAIFGDYPKYWFEAGQNIYDNMQPFKIL